MVLVALSAFCKLQRPHLSELFILSIAIFTSHYHAFYTPAVGVTVFLLTMHRHNQSSLSLQCGFQQEKAAPPFSLPFCLGRSLAWLQPTASGGVCLAPGQRALPAAPGHWRSAGSQMRPTECSHSHSELHSEKPSSAVIYFRKPTMENNNGNNRNNTNLYKAP